jgi:hypothetical protein
MKRGVLLVVLLLCLSPLAYAFEVDVTPEDIYAEVQAGGYVSELVELRTDVPIEVYASASPVLMGMVRLTRHNATAVVVHVLPPIDSAEGVTQGTIQLDVQGTSPFLGADLQRVSFPLNVTVSVKGRASAPAILDLGNEQEIKMVPLSSDTATLVIGIVIGLVALNFVLRTRVSRRRR